eukprot:4673142-Amphidinium_carterae.2
MATGLTIKEAKQKHFKYATSSPSEQCDIENKYVLGRSARYPDRRTLWKALLGVKFSMPHQTGSKDRDLMAKATDVKTYA